VVPALKVDDGRAPYTGAKLRLVGFIEAPDDEARALAEALQQLDIKPALRDRIIVRRSPY
jgi:hypothetical protein